MSELAPMWSKARMTKSQVKQYIKDMKKAQKIAEDKIKKAKDNWEFDKDKNEIEKLENLLS